MNLSKKVLPSLLLVLGVLLGGCASRGGSTSSDQAYGGIDLSGANITTRTESNGDVIQEYRVGGTLRVVQITPARGPTYYLYDNNGDGRLDRSSNPHRGDIAPVYWQLYGW